MPRLILGIESSCDETAAAVVDDRGHVLADVVASQIAVHAPFGGVVPELAARAHLENVVPVIEGALAKLDGGLDSIDAIAVTRGPGLNGALLVGIQAAKAMAWAKDIPLVGVDHLEAHLLAVFLRRDAADEARPVPAFPYVALLASGGHTAIYEVRSPLEKVLLGQTRDDAAGEAFDKTAKLLGLGYPGGPPIDALAARGDGSKVAMPRPLMNKTSLEFSFSGLKTAVARHVEKGGHPSSEQAMADLCAAVQSAIVDTLASKAVLACKQREIRRLVLGGGVAANRGLRARCAELCKRAGVALYIPPVASCTDNGAMIAWAGFAQLDADRIADGTLSPYSRSPDVVRGKVRSARRQPSA